MEEDESWGDWCVGELFWGFCWVFFYVGDFVVELLSKVR